MDSARTISLSPQPACKVSANKPIVHHESSIQTRYVQMLLQQEDEIPPRDNFLVSVYTWLLLAGWVFFPGSFTHHSEAMKNATKNNTVGTAIYDSVQKIPLVVVATLCCVIGTSGVVWLGWKWSSNFVWLIRQIFLLVNSVTGFTTALINIYTAQGGMWSSTAKATVIVTGIFTLIWMSLYLWYSNWLLMDVKRNHKAKSTNPDHGLEAS